MSMKNSLNHFVQSRSDLSIQRSIFDKSFKHLTTANAGKCVPIYLEEVLPGDTFDIGMSSLIRMSTPIFPVMDDCIADFYFFYCPNRILWSHWKNFLGENTTSAWTPVTTYSVPYLNTSTGITLGSVGDYLGLPVDPTFVLATAMVSALPFRMYRFIWNEWFRSEATMSPLPLNIGDTETDASLHTLLSACKFGDYFTTALPAPQFGASTLIPGASSGDFPVYPGSNITLGLSGAALGTTGVSPLIFKSYTQSNPDPVPANTTMNVPSNTYLSMNGGFACVFSAANATNGFLYPANLWAKNTGSTGTINQLRQAYQVQKILERNARCGTRYREILYAHYGVTVPDSTVQIPEFLGHQRVTLNMDQVIQSSATGATGTPIGTASAYSKTAKSGHVFTKSFTEHGYIMGIMVIRTAQSYANGVNRMWHRRTLYDFYTPELAYIGEQSIRNDELYFDSADPTGAFGYQEAWADYRYGYNRITGLFNPNVTGNLASWHYGQAFASTPILGSGFIQASDVPLKRSLAVQSNDPDQFLCDFWFNVKATRPMPTYSIPGYSDHF